MYIEVLSIIGFFLILNPQSKGNQSNQSNQNNQIIGCLLLLVAYYYYNNEKLF